MQPVKCPQCNDTFPFDPRTIWTGRGTINAGKVPIQCPKCKQWMTVELKVEMPKDEGSDDVKQGLHLANDR